MQEIEMTELQKNAVLGSLMGDATFKASGKETKAIIWNHGAKQLEYVQHKYMVLQNVATREPCIRKNPGYGEYSAILSLKSMKIFHYWYSLMHPDGSKTKVVTKEFLDQITHPIALAWWYLDDGSKQTNINSGNIATNGFPLESVQLLQEWLMNLWGIETRISIVHHSSTGKEAPMLRLPRAGFVKLVDLISPYVPPSMSYKIKIVAAVCPHCGKVVGLGLNQYCSEECRRTVRREQWELLKQDQEKYASVKLKLSEYRKEHREERNLRERERRQNLPEEKKEELRAIAREKAKKYRELHRDEVNVRKRERRARMKGDPEYERKLKEERRRYYERKKQNPEAYAEFIRKRKVYANSLERKEREKELRAIRKEKDPERIKGYMKAAIARRKQRMLEDPEYAKKFRDAQNKYQKEKREALRKELGEEEFLRRQREKYRQKRLEETPEQRRARLDRRNAMLKRQREKRRTEKDSSTQLSQ